MTATKQDYFAAEGLSISFPLTSCRKDVFSWLKWEKNCRYTKHMYFSIGLYSDYRVITKCLSARHDYKYSKISKLSNITPQRNVFRVLCVSCLWQLGSKTNPSQRFTKPRYRNYRFYSNLRNACITNHKKALNTAPQNVHNYAIWNVAHASRQARG